MSTRRGWMLALTAWIALLIIAVSFVGVSPAARAAEVLAPTPTRPAPPPLPTGPSPTVSPSPSPNPILPAVADGALIWLRVVRPQVQDNSADFRWQDLWTAVQWQDALGDWHAVEGWRGGLDDFTGGEGRKVWWLPGSLAGRGPFRWLVYAQPGGALLATSSPFYLPGSAGRIEVVTATLTF